MVTEVKAYKTSRGVVYDNLDDALREEADFGIRGPMTAASGLSADDVEKVVKALLAEPDIYVEALSEWSDYCKREEDTANHA